MPLSFHGAVKIDSLAHLPGYLLAARIGKPGPHPRPEHLDHGMGETIRYLQVAQASLPQMIHVVEILEELLSLDGKRCPAALRHVATPVSSS
jgi:hypothetical protein